VPDGRKAAHVAADFGQDDASAQFVDAGNGGQEADGGAKGLDTGVDLLIDLIDRHRGRVLLGARSPFVSWTQDSGAPPIAPRAGDGSGARSLEFV
jgi:hypothetical protein